jgi:hypothetical protein
MKMNPKLLGMLITLCALPVCCEAQSYWKLDFQGTLTRTNENGKIVKTTITEDSLIKSCATTMGLTNTQGARLALAYHFRQDGVDTLEVVNATNINNFHCEIMQFAFQQSYTNLDGTQIKSFAYVYTWGSQLFPDSSGMSRGSAIIATSVTGEKTNINGTVQLWLGPFSDNHPIENATIVSGNFKSIKPLELP